MGIMHFAGLGKSPGAITSGLSYLKHKRGDSSEDGAIVEAVVIFTSQSIADGTEESFPFEYNEFEKMRSSKNSQKIKTKKVAEVVLEFVKQEFDNTEVYLVTVDTSDFNQCFEAVAKTLIKFHPPGKVGKHIWANLTGGTNVLNAALIQVAYLSGLIPKLYYTFVANVKEHGKYLQPFSDNSSEFDYREIYVIPTTFDERYQHLLETLNQLKPEGWITAKDLLNRLKGRSALFSNLDIDAFVRNYLNVWPGIARKGNRQTGQEDAVRLSSEGQKLLEMLALPWFQVLLQRDTSFDETIISGLKIKKL